MRLARWLIASYNSITGWYPYFFIFNNCINNIAFFIPSATFSLFKSLCHSLQLPLSLSPPPPRPNHVTVVVATFTLLHCYLLLNLVSLSPPTNTPRLACSPPPTTPALLLLLLPSLSLSLSLAQTVSVHRSILEPHQSSYLLVSTKNQDLNLDSYSNKCTNININHLGNIE